MRRSAFPPVALNKRDHEITEDDSLQIRTNKHPHQGRTDDGTRSVVSLSTRDRPRGECRRQRYVFLHVDIYDARTATKDEHVAYVAHVGV